MNLPNALSASRLLAIPVLMVLLMARFPNHDQLAATVFVVASLTDTLDGTLARRRGQVTELGKFLDPLADKLFILSVLIVLVQERELAAWVVVVIFSRVLLILQRPYPALGLPAYVAVALAVAFTVLSGLDYVWRFRHLLGRVGAMRP